MKVIMVGGYPGSGKSTLTRRVIEELVLQGQQFKKERLGIVKWMESKDIVILGEYDMFDPSNDKFPGTDRLPMNVQPEVQRFLLSNKDNNKVVFLEGDRLFNEKMLNFVQAHFQLVLCIVQVDRSLLEERRNSRSEQNETWRKGRETKVDRIAMSHPVHHYLKNDTEEEQEASVKELLAEIKGEWKSQEQVKSKLSNYWS